MYLWEYVKNSGHFYYDRNHPPVTPSWTKNTAFFHNLNNTKNCIPKNSTAIIYLSEEKNIIYDIILLSAIFLRVPSE